MRKILALFAAMALAMSAASTSVAAPPLTSQVNHFVGNFDLLDDTGAVAAHIVVDFREPTERRLVSGTLDITWRDYDPASPPSSFPFMDIESPPVRESHAQLAGGWFYDETLPGPWGYTRSAGAGGYLCDYTVPAAMGCRAFSVVFAESSDPNQPRWIGWQFGADTDYYPFGLTPGPGGWEITFTRTTNT